MKLSLSINVRLMIVTLLVVGLLYVSPAIAGSPIDVCSNGIGLSLSDRSDAHCTMKDCCNWYQKSHIHKVPSGLYKGIRFTVMSGFFHGCRDLVTVSVALYPPDWHDIYPGDEKYMNFIEWGGVNVTSRREGGGWREYEFYWNPLSPRYFNYVKIDVPKCYNDKSAILSLVKY